jgi:hypothetical protein
MKRGQSPWMVIVGLALLVVIILIGFLFKSMITGQVVSEDQQREIPGVVSQENYLSGVLEMHAWVINENGVKLDVKNLGDKTFLIRSLEVSGCGSANQDVLIGPGDSKILSVSCSLGKGTSFEGNVAIVYSEMNSKESQTSRGNVKDVV